MTVPDTTFNVAQLLKEPLGATRTGHVDVDLCDVVPNADLGSVQPSTDAHIAGPVRLMHSIDGVLVQGSLAGAVTQPCVRCLEPVTVPLQFELEETFVSTIDIVTGQAVEPEEEDKALWIDAHHILDLREILRQHVLLNIPIHAVCREDCKGLCPTCGKNLNEGPCDCRAEPDPRWAVLRDLLSGSEEPEQKE